MNVGENYVFKISGVAEGDRTLDHRNHNPALYQLSYSHHIFLNYH
jgi:integrase